LGDLSAGADVRAGERVSIGTVSARDDDRQVPEIVRGAERAFSHPADADLSLLAAVHKGLAAVPSGAGPGLPAQRPPGRGEDGLATRHHR